MDDGLGTEIFQRLVLANQYEILACLDPDGGDHYRDLARQIESGWPLDRLDPVSWLVEACEDPLTAEDQDFVMDLLELFDSLQRAEGEGKVGDEDRSAVAFPGFCGNYEGKYLGFLQWLRAHERFRYVRLSAPADANSHMPMLAPYRRMLAKWSELGRPRSLSAADTSAILGERRRLRLGLNAGSEPEWTDAVEPD